MDKELKQILLFISAIVCVGLTTFFTIQLMLILLDWIELQVLG
jgi:hypothetical protein